MKKHVEWLLLIFLAAGGVFFWYKLALPRFQSLDLSVSQDRSIEIAKNYLKSQRGVDTRAFKMAVEFNVDEDADRYLQKTLGISASRQFIEREHYDLFCWVVRFFKERQKEEYRIVISSATGEVASFAHIIQDTDARAAIDKESARKMAVNFLQTAFAFDPAGYIIHSEDTKKFDNRLDYTFSWQDKGVDIPWNNSREQGHARLLTNVTVSGREILSFDKNQLQIPDAFNRYVDNLKQTGQNLILIFRLIYLALLTIAIVVVVNRKNQVVARTVKPFYIVIGTVIFVLMVLEVLNGYENLLFDYPTTQTLGNYLVRQFIESVIGPFFIAVAFILPALAGESLRHETVPEKKDRSLLSALLSTFCSVNIGRQIIIGYLAAAVILGAQAVVYALGFKYCGVWDELSWLTQASTSVIPALTALTTGFQASFSEEAMFRLFAINLLTKHKVPVYLALFLSAVIWGFGHTGYEIYPMWFRGLEVTCIGVLMGIFYLRYGLVCVIAAHFLIDSFLSSLPYLLNARASFNFFSALAVISLPLFLALIAILFNKKSPEKPLSIRFNAQQEFNYKLLMELCVSKKPEELAALKSALERHGWDHAVIQSVFNPDFDRCR